MNSNRDVAVIDVVELSPAAIGVIITNEISLAIATGKMGLKITMRSDAARRIALQLNAAADAFDARMERGSISLEGVIGNA